MLEKVLLNEENAEIKLSAQPKGPRERRLDTIVRRVPGRKGEGKGQGEEEAEREGSDWQRVDEQYQY